MGFPGMLEGVGLMKLARTDSGNLQGLRRDKDVKEVAIGQELHVFTRPLHLERVASGDNLDTTREGSRGIRRNVNNFSIDRNPIKANRSDGVWTSRDHILNHSNPRSMLFSSVMKLDVRSFVSNKISCNLCFKVLPFKGVSMRVCNQPAGS